MTSSEKRATLFLGEFGAIESIIDARLALIKLLDEHAAEAINAHEKKKWEECYRKSNEQKK